MINEALQSFYTEKNGYQPTLGLQVQSDSKNSLTELNLYYTQKELESFLAFRLEGLSPYSLG